jgi:hypothetical protein
MTIMLAGGMVIAAPGMEPAHAANANLSVSTNTFGGPMVIEIIVNDASYKDDDNELMPGVTIDGNDLVMAQGSDGSWYAYVANKEIANIVNTNPLGIDFGILDVNANNLLGGSITFDIDADVYVNSTVLKSPRALSNIGTNGFGQIGLNPDQPNAWPFIQTFTFTDDTSVDVTYAATQEQIEVIVYDEDMDDFASYSTDRTTYPHTADIHLLIDDMQLNIDPTGEDIWTFNVLNGTSYYGVDSIQQINSTAQDALSYKFNGFLDIDAKNVIRFTDNLDSHGTLNVVANDGFSYVTVSETSTNTGLFENTDSSDNANVITTSNEKIRDASGIVDYNDSASSILISYFGGSVLMDKATIDGDWSSGEVLTVNVIDQDENKNTKLQDIFDVSDVDIEAIPSITIGFPITLDGNTVLSSPSGLTVDQIAAQQILDEAALIVAEDYVGALDGWLSTNSTDSIDALLNVTVAFNVITAPGGATPANVTFYNANVTISDNILAAITTTNDAIVTNDNLIITLGDKIASAITAILNGIDGTILSNTFFDTFSKRLIVTADQLTDGILQVNYVNTISDLKTFINGTNVHAFLNYDLSGFEIVVSDVSVTDGILDVTISDADTGYEYLTSDMIAEINALDGTKHLAVKITFTSTTLDGDYPLVMDFVRYGGEEGRINDAIYRYEAEESSVSSGIFTGTVEYIMLNQMNIFDNSTFIGLNTLITDTLVIIVHEDLTVDDAVQVIYLDADGEGIRTQVSAQVDAYTNSALVSFDSNNYKVADTVTVTIEDDDLNTDSALVDIYTVVSATNTISNPLKPVESRLLDITFDDNLWDNLGCGAGGLSDSMVSIVETGKSSGVFTGTFQIPKEYCTSSNTSESVTGLDITVNYVDFRDASGETIEITDSAGIRANTGSVSLDRTVYPVPWGVGTYSNFPLHDTGSLDQGDLIIHVRVNDPDFDISASGQDTIAETKGPVSITVSRGGSDLILATAGAAATANEVAEDIANKIVYIPKELGPISEIAPDAGIFELDMTIKYNDGPYTSACPDPDPTIGCILQGDILQVEYNDPTDASGSENTVTDSATFDLRNGVLQSDKSVYIIGSNMILTLIEPDFDLDNQQAESYDLDLIEWDSRADQLTIGELGGERGAFDPKPSSFRETGDSSGVFQVVIEIPSELGGDRLDRGEEIQLEYIDWGPSGADYVGDEDQDILLTIFTSNFGATVELDQKVYTWTDKVYITIVAPDLNFDKNQIDEIGSTNDDNITVSTRTNDIDNYKLVETGTDTGIFTGEVILTGFPHDADGDRSTGDVNTGYDTNPRTSLDKAGPTNGFVEAGDSDGLSVSFEFSDGEIVIGSALIRWNIAEVQFLQGSYPASGTGVIRVIDPDMNIDPEAVDNFNIDVWSDSDSGGIDLTVTETQEATGIFEGTVFFTVSDQSSGSRLRVAEGDTVVAKYEDNTLPEPYTTADELAITATTLIGTVVPPLERAPAANLRTVDAFDNNLDIVSVDQQVQITADLSNGQDRVQDFAYLVQIQDGDGVTVSLAWITGSLAEGQSFSPALSWIPTTSGSYTATAFVWESVDNPTALSPPVSTTISVSYRNLFKFSLFTFF